MVKTISYNWEKYLIASTGTVSLELQYLPRGAKTAKTCSLENLASHAPTINLFRTKRTRGWWPCRGTDKDTKAEILGVGDL